METADSLKMPGGSVPAESGDKTKKKFFCPFQPCTVSKPSNGMIEMFEHFKNKHSPEWDAMQAQPRIWKCCAPGVNEERFSLLVAYGLWLMAYGLWLMAYGLWLMDYGLWIMDYGLWTITI
jgi:hypothetical protein